MALDATSVAALDLIKNMQDRATYVETSRASRSNIGNLQQQQSDAVIAAILAAGTLDVASRTLVTEAIMACKTWTVTEKDALATAVPDASVELLHTGGG